MLRRLLEALQRRGSPVGAKARPKAKLTTRVYRKAEDAWYTRDPKTGELKKEPTDG